MKMAGKWISAITVVSLAVLLCMTVGLPVVRGQAAHVRWDIVSINFTTTPFTASPGGQASASANDGSHIVLTGSGTFVAPAGGDGTSSATTTSDGTWAVFASGAMTPSATGTYEVTGLVRWENAGGTVTQIDLIGDPSKRSGGLAVLRVEFSDGSHGVLAVSCHLPAGTPASVFEGITVSKGFTDYWNRQAPVAGVNANRTVFHVD